MSNLTALPATTTTPDKGPRSFVASQARITPSTIGSPTSHGDSAHPQDSRDPFVPFFAIRKDSAIQETDPLTKYELGDLRLTAIIRDHIGNYSASVETLQGRTFIVKKGMKIGNRGGFISDIAPPKLLVSEYALDPMGQRSLRIKDLTMRTPPTPYGMTGK